MASGTSLTEPLTARPPERPIVGGVDMARTRDTSRRRHSSSEREDGRSSRVLSYLDTDGSTMPVDASDVMEYLRELDRTYDLQGRELRSPLLRRARQDFLTDEGLPMIEVPQSLERMTKAIGGHLRGHPRRPAATDATTTTRSSPTRCSPRYPGSTIAASPWRRARTAAISMPRWPWRSPTTGSSAEMPPVVPLVSWA